MKATDLRIGNVVMLYGTETLIHPTDFKKWVKSSDNWEMSAFEPIPLTEEWLIKFGFNKDGILFEKEKNAQFAVKKWTVGCFDEWIIFWGYSRLVKTDIKYVHQLQNLYHALTGEELTTQTSGE